MELSKTDRAIIEKLRENSRQPHRAIALALNVSEETVRRRAHAMVEAGVIHFGIKVSAKHMGYNIAAMLIVTMQPGQLFSVSMPNPFAETAHIGQTNWTIDHRLVIQVTARGMGEVHALISDIRQMDGVENVSVDFFHHEGDWYI